jgi:hypothetical protein
MEHSDLSQAKIAMLDAAAALDYVSTQLIPRSLLDLIGMNEQIWNCGLDHNLILDRGEAVRDLAAAITNRMEYIGPRVDPFAAETLERWIESRREGVLDLHSWVLPL